MKSNGMSRREALQRLGLEDRASAGEIKKAYRRLAVLHHPDRNPEETEKATERFKYVTEAYDTLTSSAGAELQDLGLRGPEAFTSRLSRWATEIGGDLTARREKRIQEKERQDAEYKRKEAERVKEQEKLDRKWQSSYQRGKISWGKPTAFTEAKRRDYVPPRPRTSTTAKYQEWESNPVPKTKLAFPKSEPQLSAEEQIRHYYKQAEDRVLKETGPGSSPDNIARKIVGRHKVTGQDITERLAQAIVYTKRVVFREVKTIPKEEVAETGKAIAEAGSIDQLLITGSAVQAILSDWDQGRGAFSAADQSRDYLQPRRYSSFFISTYRALLPHCQSTEDILQLAKLIDTARLYEHKDNTLQENAEEIANLIAEAVTGATLGFAQEVLKIVKHSLGTRYGANVCPRKAISQKYLMVVEALNPPFEGYTPDRKLGLINIIDRIQGYKGTCFSLRSFQQLASFISAIARVIPGDKLAAAQRLVEPLSIGGKGYSQDLLEKAVESWKNIFKEVLPFYDRLDENGTSLFNQAMVALEQLSGREYFEDGTGVKFSWTKEILPTVEAAAYGGKLIVEESLKCPEPRRVIEGLGKFLREYRFSEFFPVRRKKNWIPFTPAARQKQAYAYLSGLQQKHKSSPLDLSPEQLETVLRIYFK